MHGRSCRENAAPQACCSERPRTLRCRSCCSSCACSSAFWASLLTSSRCLAFLCAYSLRSPLTPSHPSAAHQPSYTTSQQKSTKVSISALHALFQQLRLPVFISLPGSWSQSEGKHLARLASASSSSARASACWNSASREVTSPLFCMAWALACSTCTCSLPSGLPRGDLRGLVRMASFASTLTCWSEPSISAQP